MRLSVAGERALVRAQRILHLAKQEIVDRLLLQLDPVLHRHGWARRANGDMQVTTQTIYERRAPPGHNDHDPNNEDGYFIFVRRQRERRNSH